MKYLLLADIHGNIYALEKCLKNLSKNDFDEIIFLGDYISDIPRSHEVIEFIKKCQKEYTCHTIIGNREERVMGYINGNNPDWTLDTRFADAVYTAMQLTEADIEWINKLPEEIVLEVCGKKIHITHDFEERFDYTGVDFKLYGHFHNQFSYFKDNMMIINPGSVGLSVDNQPVMQYSILEITDNTYRLENYNVKYDMTDVIDSIRECPTYNSAYKWGNLLELILKTGKDYIYLCIEEYDKLRKINNIEVESLDYWNKAQENLGLTNL